MFSNYIKYGIRYSLRYILKYIIRVVIFFSIIYLISFLSGKHLFISDVHAQEIIQSPSSMFVFNPDQSANELPLTRATKSSISLWGYSFKTYSSKESIVFMYDTPSDLKNKTIDFHFLIYNDLWSNQLQPDRVVVKNDSTGSINSCVVSSSSRKFKEETLTQPSSKFNVVICENVVLTDDRFQVYLFDNFESSSYTFVGISRIFAKNNSVSSSSDIKNSVDKQTQEQKKTNDTLTNDNVDSSTNQGSSFFNDFDSGDEASLTDIVSLPLQYVQHLNDSCQPFTIPTGKLGNITIPCLSSIWSSTSFAGIINTASLIINGIICYKLLSSLFLFIKDLKDPDDDKVEVMNL